MSKSKGNVVSPEDIIDKYGADTARLFILFASPPERDLEWSDQGVEGCHRFLNRVWRLIVDLVKWQEQTDAVGTTLNARDEELRYKVHYTIRKVTEDIEKRFNFNTAISAIMELVNAMHQYRDAAGKKMNPEVVKESLEALITLLAPFAPHIAEELWESTGHQGSVHLQPWLTWDEEALKRTEIEMVVQVNGKVRDKILVPVEISKDELEEMALSLARVRETIGKKQVVKVVTVPNKLVNIVVK
jgi:leucyl-tRNA synthetase